MSTHNVCFRREIRKISAFFKMKNVPYLLLCCGTSNENYDIFLISAQKLYCGYSLALLMSTLMVSCRNKKNIYLIHSYPELCSHLLKNNFQTCCLIFQMFGYNIKSSRFPEKMLYSKKTCTVVTSKLYFHI